MQSSDLKEMRQLAQGILERLTVLMHKIEELDDTGVEHTIARATAILPKMSRYMEKKFEEHPPTPHQLKSTKFKDAARKYWDSPAGIKRRRKLSIDKAGTRIGTTPKKEE